MESIDQTKKSFSIRCVKRDFKRVYKLHYNVNKG